MDGAPCRWARGTIPKPSGDRGRDTLACESPRTVTDDAVAALRIIDILFRTQTLPGPSIAGLAVPVDPRLATSGSRSPGCSLHPRTPHDVTPTRHHRARRLERS